MGSAVMVLMASISAAPGMLSSLKNLFTLKMLLLEVNSRIEVSMSLLCRFLVSCTCSQLFIFYYSSNLIYFLLYQHNPVIKQGLFYLVSLSTDPLGKLLIILLYMLLGKGRSQIHFSYNLSELNYQVMQIYNVPWWADNVQIPLGNQTAI